MRRSLHESDPHGTQSARLGQQSHPAVTRRCVSTSAYVASQLGLNSGPPQRRPTREDTVLAPRPQAHPNGGRATTGQRWIAGSPTGAGAGRAKSPSVQMYRTRGDISSAPVGEEPIAWRWPGGAIRNPGASGDGPYRATSTTVQPPVIVPRPLKGKNVPKTKQNRQYNEQLPDACASAALKRD